MGTAADAEVEEYIFGEENDVEAGETGESSIMVTDCVVVLSCKSE